MTVFELIGWITCLLFGGYLTIVPLIVLYVNLMFSNRWTLYPSLLLTLAVGLVIEYLTLTHAPFSVTFN